jgi:hypothetical protein
MDASLISEMEHLQPENARLKRMCADLAMQNELVKKARAKSNEAIYCRQSIAQQWPKRFPTRDGPICR